MEPEEFHRIRSLSNTHWWYQSLAEIATSVLASYPDTERVLDAGCGTGFLASSLQGCQTYGIDSSPIARDIWQMDGTRNTSSASVDALPFLGNQFDLAFCIDVIYHRDIRSDANALSEVYRVLRPGGTFLLHTAAFEFLRNRHDDNVHTARRYTQTQVRQILTQAGFVVSTLSYRNLIVLPFIVGSKFIASKGSNLVRVPKWLNLFMRTVSRLEWSAIRSNVHMPCGSSVIVVARKPLG